MSSKEDILVELNDKELEELAAIYESHKTELPHLHSFMQNCLRAKKNGMEWFVRVFSPNGSWREDGTFIASMPVHGHDIVLHSLDHSGKNLIEGFSKTQRFKFPKEQTRTLFYAVHERFSSKVSEVLENVLRQEILWADELNAWCLDKEMALKNNITTPPDVYVKELAPEDVPILNSVWPYRYPDSDKKISDCLKLTKGFGVYLKSNNQLVSWVTSSPLGQLTALQTLEEHKRKGYGTLAVFHMSKYLAENGFDSFGTVYVGNTGSETLLAKLGFKKKFSVPKGLVYRNTNIKNSDALERILLAFRNPPITIIEIPIQKTVAYSKKSLQHSETHNNH